VHIYTTLLCYDEYGFLEDEFTTDITLQNSGTTIGRLSDTREFTRDSLHRTISEIFTPSNHRLGHIVLYSYKDDGWTTTVTYSRYDSVDWGKKRWKWISKDSLEILNIAPDDFPRIDTTRTLIVYQDNYGKTKYYYNSADVVTITKSIVDSVDEYGNWTKKSIFIQGRLNEIIYRTIEYSL
jgi:hypothetical protein